MADRELEEALINAAMAWQSARLYYIAMRLGPHHDEAYARHREAESILEHAVNAVIVCRAGVEKEFEVMLSLSSLGTVEAIAIRAEADPEVVAATLKRADALDSARCPPDCPCGGEGTILMVAIPCPFRKDKP